MKMKKIYLILFLLFAFAVLTCTSGVASAINPKYVGNTMVDLVWVPGNVTDFSKYELCRDGSPNTTITNRSTTFYRDTGLTKGNTYHYELRYYNATGKLMQTVGMSATTGEVHGTITQDTTWTAASSPYTLTEYVQVFNGTTLTIESGVKVINYAIRVGGFEGQKEVLYADNSSFYDCGITVYDEAHAEIKNCSFEDKGINILNSSNNTLTGNTVYNSGTGIYLGSSSHNTLTGNTVYNSGFGIYLGSSSHNTLTGNTAYNNSGLGISLVSSSDYNTLTGNTVYNSNSFSNGIALSYSSHNTLTGNTAYNNSGLGISLDSSDYNTLTHNTANNNTYEGIDLDSSSNNVITGNTASNNSGCGISLDSSDYNTLTGNICNENLADGIDLYSSSNNMLTGNTVYNNSLKGIYLHSSSNNVITGNTVSNNDDRGIYLAGSSNNVITGNTVSNNDDRGIYLAGSSNNNIMDNTVSNTSGYGIALYKSSSNNMLTGNTVYNNSLKGIYLHSSSNNVITGNTVSNNSGFGISLGSSDYNTLTGNICNENLADGIGLYYSSDYNTLTDNTAYNNAQSGILLSSSSDNTLTGNTASNNDRLGIYLRSSSNNTLTSNTVYNNSLKGIYLRSSSNNVITGNTASNNSGCGIYLVSSSDYNTIYNNYFNNAYDNGNNIWNIAKTLGTNIVYGPYLGGNYWSDYTGVDADGDGIGDTPHNISGGTNKDYLPLAEFIDLWIEDIKIIQTVEDAEQSLVALKPTMVRVFVDGSINPNKEVEVKTKLKLILGDSKELEKDVTIKEQRWYTLLDKKTGKNSINFFIPQSKNFATNGQRTVTAIINPDNNPLESNRTNNPNIKSCYVKTPKSKFEVEFVVLNVGAWDGMDISENLSYFASSIANSNFLKAVYPVSDQSYKAHFGKQYDPWNLGKRWIAWRLHKRAAASKNIDRVVGMCPVGWLGGGDVGKSLGKGWYGVFVTEGVKFDAAAAHEIMHTYGKYCFEEEDYLPSNNGPYGRLADDGWWVEKRDDGCRVSIYKNRYDLIECFLIGKKSYSRNNSFSYMGAEAFQYWTNKTDYEFLYRKLVSSTTTSSHESYPIVKASDSPGKLILLSGLIWSNGSVTIDPIYSGDFLDPEEEEVSSSKYYLEFYHDATLLKTYRFDTIEFTDSPEIQDGFVVTVEMPENTTAIYIKRNDGTPIATISPSDNVPSVELTYPNGGEFLTGDVDVTWDAEDVDGDSLTYLLYFSDDSGSTWRTIAMDIEGSSYHWDSSSYPGGDNCMLKIVASDGFNSAEDATESIFSLSDKSPFVAILSPENNSIFGKEEEIYFDGIAYDPQGDILNYSYFNWTSDIDGYIGTGQTLSLSNLSLGTHEIKLRVKNSAGLTGTSESKFVTVSTNPPPNADFYSNVTWGNATLTVQFNDTSSHEPTSWSWDFGDNSTSTEQNPSHTYSTDGRYTVSLTATNAAGSDTETKKDYIIVESLLPEAIFDTGEGTYPSIFGTHRGTIKPSCNINVSRLYTYSCPGTSGHTEYVWVYGNDVNESSSWDGYSGDWHNITFSEPFTLETGKTYNYTIRTGSYPQIIHIQNHTTLDGSLITCEEFIDANGKKYDGWIPAIKLF